MSKKERIDVLLVDQGFFASQDQAQRALMAGIVLVNDERCDKAGTKVVRTSTIRIKGQPQPYVSRGGLKLAKAIESFALSLDDAVVLDIGSSTGGFTDCALQNGAKQVYAIDVGYGQLDWKLRSDPRVIVMERTNFRHLTPEALQGEQPTFSVIDVSFISLRIILPTLATFLKPMGEVMTLIKPQFEAEREQVGKNGVIRDPEVHKHVLTSIIDFALRSGYAVKGLDFSPITGSEGNIEFLLYLMRTEESETDPTGFKEQIEQVVSLAHHQLMGQGVK